MSDLQQTLQELKKYARHKPTCQSVACCQIHEHSHVTGPCTCGLSALLTAGSTEQEKEKA